MPCQKCFQFWSDEFGKFWVKQSQAFFLGVRVGWGVESGGMLLLRFAELLTLYCLKAATGFISKFPVRVSVCWRIWLLPLRPLFLTISHYGRRSLVHIHCYLQPSPLALPVVWKCQVSARMWLHYRGLPRSSSRGSQPCHITLVPFHDWFFSRALVSLRRVSSVHCFIACPLN